MNFLIDPAIAIYVAMSVALLVWIGIFLYLWRIDGELRELKRRISATPPDVPPTMPQAILERRAGDVTDA